MLSRVDDDGKDPRFQLPRRFLPGTGGTTISIDKDDSDELERFMLGMDDRRRKPRKLTVPPATVLLSVLILWLRLLVWSVSWNLNAGRTGRRKRTVNASSTEQVVHFWTRKCRAWEARSRHTWQETVH